MSSPCDPKLAAPNMSAWLKSEPWRRVADGELQLDRPRLMVHQHSCSPGMSAHLLPQLQSLNATLKQRSNGRCRLVLATDRSLGSKRRPLASFERERAWSMGTGTWPRGCCNDWPGPCAKGARLVGEDAPQGRPRRTAHTYALARHST